MGTGRIGLRFQGQNRSKKEKNEKWKTANRWFHFVLHSRTRGSLKVGLSMKCIARAANFAGLLAWRVNLARLTGLCAAFPRLRLAFWTLTGPTKRFIAVTCAVSIPPYSRASATAFLLFFPLDFRGRNKRNLIRLPVFPSTKFSVIVRGAKPASG